METLLSLEESARLLSISERTMRRLVQSGRAPAAKVAGKWRLDPARLRQWVHAGGEAAAAGR